MLQYSHSFVLQYASHLYRNTFGKILVVVVTGMFLNSNELLSQSKVLDLDGCFRRERPYHHHYDSLVWTGPQ